MKGKLLKSVGATSN